MGYNLILSILIFKQIVSMFLMIMVGFVLIKTKVIEKNAGSYLAKIVMYVVLPCTIIHAFQIERSEETINGLLFAFGIALICNVCLVLGSYGFKKIFKLNTVEQASITYPNSGDILIPLVSSVLSTEMTVYCCAFMVVQLLFMFTHGMQLLANEKDLIKIVKNPNVIAIILGILLLVFNIEIPEIIDKTMTSFASMVAPLSMLVIGCSIANCNIVGQLKNKRIYLVVLIRQILIPFSFLLVIYFLGAKNLNALLQSIILIIYMAMASCPAATVVNIAQTYDKDPEYASVINVIGVIALIFTLPLMVYIFQSII